MTYWGFVDWDPSNANSGVKCAAYNKGQEVTLQWREDILNGPRNPFGAPIQNPSLQNAVKPVPVDAMMCSADTAANPQAVKPVASAATTPSLNPSTTNPGGMAKIGNVQATIPVVPQGPPGSSSV